MLAAGDAAYQLASGDIIAVMASGALARASLTSSNSHHQHLSGLVFCIQAVLLSSSVYSRHADVVWRTSVVRDNCDRDTTRRWSRYLFFGYVFLEEKNRY